MTIWKATVHQFYDCLRLVGLRDRLRCPQCKAVGTWKPHGGFLDFEDVRKVRRWMCKWCGYYRGPEGSFYCHQNWKKGCWCLPFGVDSEWTPTGQMATPKVQVERPSMGLVEDGVYRRYKPDPWRG